MFGLSIIGTIYVIIGGGLLFALYHLIKSDERWFQVRMGGLIFVGLLVLVPLLLMRCNPDILMGENVGVTSVQAEENNHFLQPSFFLKELSAELQADGTFETRLILATEWHITIPQVTFWCIAWNDAKILKTEIKGNKVYGLEEPAISVESLDGLKDFKLTSVIINGETVKLTSIEVGVMYDVAPEDLEFVFITDKDPGVPLCHIRP